MITSGIYASGSYGFRPRDRERLTMRLWFCGGYRPRGGYNYDGLHNVCVHETRSDARACPNRVSGSEADR